MNRREYHIGPGAALLMLVVVVLCLSVLGMLTFMSARSDGNMAARSVTMTQLSYAATDAAERTYASVDAVLAEKAAASQNDEEYLALVADALPVNCAISGDTVIWEESAGSGRILHCALRILPLGSEVRSVWSEHYLMTIDDGIELDG